MQMLSRAETPVTTKMSTHSHFPLLPIAASLKGMPLYLAIFLDGKRDLFSMTFIVHSHTTAAIFETCVCECV
jgi:hypothetical protein